MAACRKHLLPLLRMPVTSVAAHAGRNAWHAARSLCD